MMNVKLRHFRVPLCNGAKWVFHPYIFSVNKWNRFQDTSRLQKKLVWLSCGGGGGGARGVYVAHGLNISNE